jgi:hypothetical protein
MPLVHISFQHEWNNIRGIWDEIQIKNKIFSYPEYTRLLDHMQDEKG